MESKINYPFRVIALPYLTWVLASIIQKAISWRLYQGRVLFPGYGGDKSLANLMVEPLLLGLLLLFAVVAFHRRGKDIPVWLGPVLALTVVLAVPALPE